MKPEWNKVADLKERKLLVIECHHVPSTMLITTQILIYPAALQIRDYCPLFKVNEFRDIK